VHGRGPGAPWMIQAQRARSAQQVSDTRLVQPHMIGRSPVPGETL
jgi:hypothetical protein